MSSVSNHLQAISNMIKTCAVDIRDEWPTNPDSYTKSETISRGTFGIVRYAEVSDPTFMLDGFDSRSCVIKTIYLRRRFDNILREIGPSNSQQFSSKTSQYNEDINETNHNTYTTKLFRLYRRILMELFILSRCRHANIMHLHAVFMSAGDMHLVLPRFYMLQNLIQLYKRRKQSEPVPITIIAKILRQLCFALDFLQRVGIAHRDVQPENIFLTRRGTVKLGHFAQAKPVFDDAEEQELRCCRTPVGREEFMSFEKQHNLYLGNNIDECMDYSFSADVWSLGVLVLSMVSYFPHEQCQKLHKNFALVMHEEQMPFIWLTVDMLQLRSRLVKSGGEELKLFLSDKLLTVNPQQRLTVDSLPDTSEMRKWCKRNVEEDSVFLRKNFIDEVDFANHLKLENDAPNYDALETKDIPAEFYWYDTWKKLEDMHLKLQLFIHTNTGIVNKGMHFKYSYPEPFFRMIYSEVIAAHLELTDLMSIDYEIKQAIFEFVRQKIIQPDSSTASIRKEILLPKLQSTSAKSNENTHRRLEIEIEQVMLPQHRLRLASASP